MESLRTYLNSLTTEQQFFFARECGTTIGYLRKAISRRQKIGGQIVRLLEEKSGGMVIASELRPDIFPPMLAAA